MIDLSDYYSGGYFLIRANKPDWSQLQTDLLPDKLISLSQHICSRLEVYWGWTPGNREAALKFGIPESKLDEFIEWCKIEFESDLDITSMFYTAEAARRFIERFLLDTRDLYLVGVGLYKQLEEANWREPANGQIRGIEKQIERYLSLEQGGSALGFEVVSFDYSDFGCSWLCNYLQEEMYKRFGIRPGGFGLIETREQAQQVYEWIAEDPAGRAELGAYDYWLLVSYPLSSQ